MPTASRASEWSLLPASFQTGWPALQRAFPGVQVKFRWGRVHAIYGRPFGGGRTPLQSANNFISEFGGDLFGIDSNTELVLNRVVEPAIGEGPAYVHFHQEYAGRPLDGAHLSLTIANRAGYPITLASGFIHPSPGAYMRGRQRTREQTIQIARDLFGQRNVSIDRITEVIWPLGHAPEYGWAMNVTPADAPDDAERITVGTFDGKVLRRTNLVHRFGNYTATVKGEKSRDEEVPIQCDTGTDLDVPLQWVTVSLASVSGAGCGAVFASDVTDANGQATFTNVPPQFCVTAAFENQWFVLWDDRIQNGCGTPPCCNGNPNNCVARKQEGDQSDPTFFFTDATQLRTVQLVTAWRWLNTARDWVETLDASFDLGNKLEVRGNVLGGCTPGYNGAIPRMNLTNRNVQLPANCDPLEFPNSCECRRCVPGNPDQFFFLKDLHLNTIAVHEYGHHLHTQEHPGASSGTWMENIADSISAFVTNEPHLGKDICEASLGGPCEDGDLSRNIATPDLVWPNFVTGLNANGRPMANAYWDMRVGLADDDLAGKIVLHSIKKLPGAIDPVIALHAVLVDDDGAVTGKFDSDSDLSNGSPDYETINAAFRQHGLATDNVAYVTIDWSASAPGDVPDNVDLDVAVTVNPGSLTLKDCILDPPCPVVLRWRKNSGTSGPGAWVPVDMTYRSAQDDYHATISSANYGVGDVLDFYVRAEVTDSTKQYTCFPTQAQFDWSVPNADNIPEERDFFSVLVTDSPNIPALSEDLRDDPSWTVGVDEWEFGAPNLAEAGEQPGNDYPFDNDVPSPPGSAPTLPNCYFTSAAGSVQGEWELTTKAFDLSDSNVDYAVVSYALWFFARGAKVGADRFEVEILGSDSTWYPIQTIDVDPVVGDNNDTKRVRWIRQRITVKKQTVPGEVPFGSAMKLKFRAIQKLGSGATVEAVVDEVRVWGVSDQ